MEVQVESKALPDDWKLWWKIFSRLAWFLTVLQPLVWRHLCAKPQFLATPMPLVCSRISQCPWAVWIHILQTREDVVFAYSWCLLYKLSLIHSFWYAPLQRVLQVTKATHFNWEQLLQKYVVFYVVVNLVLTHAIPSHQGGDPWWPKGGCCSVHTREVVWTQSGRYLQCSSHHPSSLTP